MNIRPLHDKVILKRDLHQFFSSVNFYNGIQAN